jgi:protein SCO1/2
MRRLILLTLLMAAAVSVNAQPVRRAALAQGTQARHAMTGMVLSVDVARKSVVVSHDSVPGLMPAMTMPFEVRESKELTGLVAGAKVSFTLVLGKESAHIEQVRVIRYESIEQDPLAARRLSLLRAISGSAPKVLAVGQPVPDFTLTNQVRKSVSLSQFRGKVVALNFIYTSCVLPQFCYRVANHFATVRNRFKDRMGRDLVLLTVTFDPARDTPERLAEYARQWQADPANWHFMTGAAPQVERVCNMFGVDFFADEGLMSHSVRTAVIDRHGGLVANIEGNQYTAAQLGDLVQTALK